MPFAPSATVLPSADTGTAMKPRCEDRGNREIRERKGRPTAQKLADEFVAAFNREGTAVSRRENVHRMADANKAFAHFAW